MTNWKLRRYLVVVTGLFSVSAFANGDAKLVFFSLSGGFQVVLLLTLLIWSHKKRVCLAISVVNLIVIWSMPWSERDLAQYYLLLFVEPVALTILLLLSNLYFKGRAQDR